MRLIKNKTIDKNFIEGEKLGVKAEKEFMWKDLEKKNIDFRIKLTKEICFPQIILELQR